MAQDTTWTGAVLTESDIIAKLMHEDAGWTSWTPSVVQSGAVTTTNNRSLYARAARLIIADYVVTCTGTGTGANMVTISLPVTAASSNANSIVGEGWIYDSSAGFFYFGIAFRQTTTTASFVIRTNASAATYLGTTSFTAALASGDILSGRLIYEAAS